MKRFQLVIRVLVAALFCIHFTFADSTTIQKAIATDSIMRVNKDMIQSDFLKYLVSINYIDFPSNSEDPFVSFQDFYEYKWSWIPVYAPQDVAYTVITRHSLEKAYPKDCIAVPVVASKGDFVIVYYNSESHDHDMTSWWLMTYDYYGNRIDSLEFARYGSYLDLSSRLNQDLTINQTFIDWENSDTGPHKDDPDSWKGTRYDFTYNITSSGHFRRTGCLQFESKIYNEDDLEESCRFQPHRGIHRGKEKLIGPYDASQKDERFPIYGHYTGGK